MINIVELFKMFSLDDINRYDNSETAINKFNRTSKRAEIYLIKYLTGALIIEQNKFPKPFDTQKNTDYLKDFIVPFSMAGDYTFPKDYLIYDNMYKLANKKIVKDCDDNIIDANKNGNIPIEIVDRQKFLNRSRSYIKGILPTINNPIVRIINNSFEFMPQEIGSVVLEYIRYPKYGKLVTKFDAVFNDTILDENNSKNYEWGEWATEPLLWFMNDRHASHIREKTLKEFNMPNKEEIIN